MTQEEINSEKSNAAFSSLIAALVLTGLKLVVGIHTNSLGILSEAAHSGFDLLAAGITLFAVRYAAFPADSDHHYGHGKIENLSALVEALLLLVTCIWIIYEALDRLFFNPVVVEASIWALAVMSFSIIVDVSRSRMLMRIAKKHKSQALEADALHFSTDIWSSAVVIVGLAALYLASFLPAASFFRPWLERADSIAALGVSGIIIYVSITLAKQAVDVLLDAGDSKLAEKISEAVSSEPQVQGIKRLRLRRSGPTVFADIAIMVDASLVIEQIEELRIRIASLAHKIDPDIDITLEVLPTTVATTDTITKVRSLAIANNLDVHAIEFLDLEAKQSANSQNQNENKAQGQTQNKAQGQALGILQLHIEIEPTQSLQDAHSIVSEFETILYKELSNITIVTHIEPKRQHTGKASLIHGEKSLGIQTVIKDILSQEESVSDCHNVLIRNYGGGEEVSFHCRMAAETSVLMAHEATSRIQARLHQNLPELKRVIVHMEPLKDIV